MALKTTKKMGAREMHFEQENLSAKKKKEQADEIAKYHRLAAENARGRNQLAHRAALMMGTKNKPVNQANAIKACLFRHVNHSVCPYPIEHEMLYKRVSTELNLKKHFNPNHAEIQAAMDSLLNQNQLEYHVSDAMRLYARPLFAWDMFDSYYSRIAERERDEIIREELARIPKQQELLRLQEKQRVQKTLDAKKKAQERKEAKLKQDAQKKQKADELEVQKRLEMENLARAQKLAREQERYEAEKQQRSALEKKK